MLKRLEGEEPRLAALINSGELTAEGAALGRQQLAADREKLLAELRQLESEDVPRSA
jgi:hypothetical protein